MRGSTRTRDEASKGQRAPAPSPRRVQRLAFVYGMGATVLIGWAAHLSLSLPARITAHHWNVAWVGFDGFIVAALAYTSWRAAHNDRRVVIPAVAVATLLVADAWMDVSTASGADLWKALVLAGALELPLAALSLFVAHRALAGLVRR